MKISFNANISFGRQLKSAEEGDYTSVLKSAKQKAGNSGQSVLIVPSTVLPQKPESNTGAGNLLNKESEEFFDFVRKYWGIDTIQLLPEGRPKSAWGSYFPYSGTALSLGEQLINPEVLTKLEYANLISAEDLKNIVNSNVGLDSDIRVNFENIFQENSATEKVLRKAYDNLVFADTSEKCQMLEKVSQFTQENKDWLESKAIYHDLVKENNSQSFVDWNNTDKNLFNSEIISAEAKQKRINELVQKYKTENEYYYFKQYLAEEHLKLSKERLNSKGMKLYGDFLINFSPDEKWANPKAFLEGYSIGFGCPALNLENPEAKELLAKKAQLFARRYDGMRIDMAWAYANQPLIKFYENSPLKRMRYDGKILDFIVDNFKSVKGESYSPQSIQYEFAADARDFDMFEYGKLKPFLKDKVSIICSDYLSENWANVSAHNTQGWDKNFYILGTTNHDSQPMKLHFAQESARKEQASVLAKLLKIPEPKTLKEFIRAKFAEPMRAKNNMLFYADVLNLEGKYCCPPLGEDCYRLKISSNWMKNYFKSLQNGEGFNPMDALEKAFISKGLDKTEPELFQKIIKYKNILEEPESVSAAKTNNKKAKVVLMCGGIILTLALVLFAIIRSKNTSENQLASR